MQTKASGVTFDRAYLLRPPYRCCAVTTSKSGYRQVGSVSFLCRICGRSYKADGTLRQKSGRLKRQVDA